VDLEVQLACAVAADRAQDARLAAVLARRVVGEDVVEVVAALALQATERQDVIG
jgi:hypothetical protein